MNQTPHKPTVNENRNTDSQMSLRQRKRLNGQIKFLTALTIFITVILVFSILLNAALLLSGESKTSGGEAASSDIGFTKETVSQSKASSSAEDSGVPSADITEDTVPLDTESEIDRLYEMVKSYAEAAQNDFSAQADAYDTLLELLKIDNRPIHIHKNEIIPGDTSDESNASEDTDVLKTPAQVAFAYVDLSTGYTFSYNADDAMYGASLTKAPYVYALLKEIEEFDYNKRNFTSDGKPLYDDKGNALFEGQHPNLDKDGNIIYLPGEEKYDLSREWVYDSKTMFVKGSGMIQDKADGFTLTYRELIEYTMKYSDNIAYSALTRLYGESFYKELMSELAFEGPSHGFMHLTANDCISFVKVLYEFTESDSRYGAIMKNAMLSSIHGLMIPTAVSPNKCAHKYGWDIGAYCDLGIVYHERPFAVIILTDLDNGRYEDNLYIQSIVKAILALHESFTPDSDGKTK